MSCFLEQAYAKIESGDNMTKILKYLKALSGLNLFFWSTFWLMIILILGTIDQKNIGLFESQKKYFSSLFFFIKGVPVPSGGLIIVLITVGLFSQLLFKTSFKNKRTLGISITHLGALLLLLGAFMTKINGLEGSVVIPEGQSVSYMQDYKNHEFVLNDSQGEATFIKKIKELMLNQPYPVPGGDITFVKNYDNCELIPRTTALQDATGFINQFEFQAKGVAADNTRCIEFILSQGNLKHHYGIFQDMPKSQSVELQGNKLIADIRNERISLPFTIELIDFEKKFHQGTMLSKSFKSEVYIIDGKLKTRHLIEMNAPLRYKGYTFYQSSFSENANGEITQLSVVKNAGQIFPYLSSIIICIGLLLHLLLNSQKLFKPGPQ